MSHSLSLNPAESSTVAKLFSELFKVTGGIDYQLSIKREPEGVQVSLISIRDSNRSTFPMLVSADGSTRKPIPELAQEATNTNANALRHPHKP